jgi:hypothetical protein
MGQAISIESEFCIQVPESLCVDYTVKRTSGEMDSGWRIPSECYVNRGFDLSFPSASKHANTETKHWRIFMANGKTTPEEVRYAWRRVNSIYPTELEGDEDAILSWQKATELHFDELEATRIAEGGKTPESVMSAERIDVMAALAKADAERVAGYANDMPI